MTSVGSSGMINIENIFIQWRLSPIRVTTGIHKSVNTGTVSPEYRDIVPCAAPAKGITQEEMCRTSVNIIKISQYFHKIWM